MANTPTIPKTQQHRLRTHFGMVALPFRKNVGARQMFDSSSQRDLGHALPMWLDLRGLALVTGASGVGKSITVRRFVAELDDARFTVHRFGQIPTTPTGFLRALCRRMGLPMRRYTGDMFDDVTTLLKRTHGDKAAHPVLVMDDAEGMRPATLDLVRRLTAADLDADEHISILLVGTDALLTTLHDPSLEPLRTRLAYVHALRGFGLEDTRNYVRFHLQHAGIRQDVLTDGAVRHLFQASGGVPRLVNQLALQAMIHAVVQGRDQIDDDLMRGVLLAHPLYGKPA